MPELIRDLLIADGMLPEPGGDHMMLDKTPSTRCASCAAPLESDACLSYK